ncbi:MAG: N-acetylmuramoyl-L-alanine amidase, partial [bacterium]
LVNADTSFSLYALYIKEEGLISLKEVASCLKAGFDYNPVIQEASLKKDGIRCFVWINRNKAILDKKEISLSVCPKLISSDPFVPLELVKAFVKRLNLRLEINDEKIVFAKKNSLPDLTNTNNGFWHLLKEGETLWKVSQNYGVELSSLLSLNKIIDPRFVAAGTMLYIPKDSLQTTDNRQQTTEDRGQRTDILEKKPSGSLVQKYGIKRIVLDPGHGGKDPGAIGKSGLKEKDVVLDLALSLSRELKKSLPNTEIILTRDADYYVPLAERTGLANFKKAGLFISLHANAAFSRSASGFEVYHLSAVASDKYSEDLAKIENTVVQRFKEREENLTEIILKDMAQSAFINESIDLGLLIQNNVCDRLSMNNRGVKSAFFYVLRDAKMPAVLVETGFLSNQNEEAKMKDASFKQSLVSAIANAIITYKEKYENRLAER